MLGNKQYFEWGNWPEVLLYKSFWMKVGARSHELLTLPITEIKDLDGRYLWVKDEFEQGKNIFLRNHNDDHWIQQFFDLGDKLTNQILELENTQEIEKIFKLAAECLSLSEVINLFDHAFMEMLVQLPANERQKVMDSVHPFKKTHFMQLQEAINNEVPTEDILKKYAWVGTHGFVGEPLSVEKLDEYQKAESQHSGGGSDCSHLVTLGSKLAFYRSYIVESVDKVLFSVIPELEKLAKQHNATVRDLYYMTPREVLNFTGLPNDIEERKEKYGLVGTSEGVTVLVGNDLEEEINDCIEHSVEKTGEKEVNGMTAYKGIVTGTVRVIREKNDLAQVKEGDVLISNETTPDYVTAMRKAVAVVTNLGGVTSHAAIVAREMQKPCIVGTKHATQVLNDGDEVEVDADKGVVTIIKKATEE